MPKTITVDDLEPGTEEEVETLAEAAERSAEEFQRLQSMRVADDLSDGGVVDGARVTPMQDGRKLEKGRPAAIQAWMWNGTESLLPLAWNPEGTLHDNAMHYRRKQHCLCCHSGGFYGRQCKNCLKNRCTACGGRRDPKKIIPLFYLRKENVPFPARFYGDIDCFQELCPRRGPKGFLTQQAMRVHARACHRMEYQAHLDELAEARTDELDSLRRRLDTMQNTVPLTIKGGGKPKKAGTDSWARARAAKTAKRAASLSNNPLDSTKE